MGALTALGLYTVYIIDYMYRYMYRTLRTTGVS